MRVGAYVSVRVGAIVSVVRLDFKIKITPAIPASPIDRACLGGMQRGKGAGLAIGMSSGPPQICFSCFQ